MSYREELEKRIEELEELLAVASQHGGDEINDLFIRYLAVTVQASFNFRADTIKTDQDKRDFIYKKIKLIKVLQNKTRDFRTIEIENMIKEEMKKLYIMP
jgi:hypothetical protein